MAVGAGTRDIQSSGTNSNICVAEIEKGVEAANEKLSNRWQGELEWGGMQRMVSHDSRVFVLI